MSVWASPAQRYEVEDENDDDLDDDDDDFFDTDEEDDDDQDDEDDDEEEETWQVDRPAPIPLNRDSCLTSRPELPRLG